MSVVSVYNKELWLLLRKKVVKGRRDSCVLAEESEEEEKVVEVAVEVKSRRNDPFILLLDTI